MVWKPRFADPWFNGVGVDTPDLRNPKTCDPAGQAEESRPALGQKGESLRGYRPADPPEGVKNESPETLRVKNRLFSHSRDSI